MNWIIFVQEHLTEEGFRELKEHMHIVINPKYRNLEEFVNKLAEKEWFNNNGTVLFDGRNCIKMFEVDGIKVAVKRFGRLSLPNRIIYGRLRKSKARRAYEYAAKLNQLGINSPEEVAYIEVRKNGLMDQSYFVSLYTDYESMLQYFYQRNLSATEFSTIEPLLDALAQFLYKMHEAGVIHNDLNYTNILYNECDGNKNGGPDSFDFTIIDANRMEFHSSLSLEKRMHNLRRLNVSIPAHLYILQKYAEIIGEKPQKLQLMVLKLRYEFEHKRERTAKIKAAIRGKKKGQL